VERIQQIAGNILKTYLEKLITKIFAKIHRNNSCTSITKIDR